METNTYFNVKKLKNIIHSVDAILIGAGAGLSTSAGFEYSGQRFKNTFSDFEEEYDFHDMYSGGFYPFDSFEEHWAYWSRFIYINRYEDAPKKIYSDLLKIVEDKDYFVLTTNVDHCFQKAGFDKKRLFYTQGDYGLFQCSTPCHKKTYDNQEIIKQMVLSQVNRKVPTKLIPTCPICGKPMTMNLRSDDRFVQDDGWYQAAERYELFVSRHKNLNILYLELGVGYNTPGIIKYPFWQMTLENPRAIYACINYGEAACPKEIKVQSICINDDIGVLLEQIKHTHYNL